MMVEERIGIVTVTVGTIVNGPVLFVMTQEHTAYISESPSRWERPGGYPEPLGGRDPIGVEEEGLKK
jgi:hypothetical protein